MLSKNNTHAARLPRGAGRRLALSALAGLSLMLAPAAWSASLVGEIVVVSGACPGGYIPLDGRTLDPEIYPELAAVLNVDPSINSTDTIELPILLPPFSVGNSLTGTNSGPLLPANIFVFQDGTPAIASQVNANFSQLEQGLYAVAQLSAPPPTGSLEPHLCISVGGNTPPLVEVGVAFRPAEIDVNGNESPARLVFVRVDVSGYPVVPPAFYDGNIDLGLLDLANPGIKRPNITFRLINENVCLAFESVDAAGNRVGPYPAELRLTGVQVALGYNTDKTQVPWGNHYITIQQQLSGATNPESVLLSAAFAYTPQRDEQQRPGFVAVDVIDDRTLLLKNRNAVLQQFQYRVQARCGYGNGAYSVYYDPRLKHNGGGGGGGVY